MTPVEKDGGEREKIMKKTALICMLAFMLVCTVFSLSSCELLGLGGGNPDDNNNDKNPPETIEGTVIEINGESFEMVDYGEGKTGCFFGYAELKTGDKVTIKDGDKTFGYGALSDNLSWNVYDFHGGDNGEIVIDCPARYSFDFDGEQIVISKVFAPLHGSSYQLVFDFGYGEDMNSINVSDDPQTYEDFVWFLRHEKSTNTKETLDYIEANGLYIYSVMLELDEETRFNIKNLTDGSIIDADHLAEGHRIDGCITKNGEYIETLKNGKYCITYIPCYNVFSIEYYGLEEENKDILFAFNEDIIGLTPDAEGVVRYNNLEAAEGAYFTFAITETDYLPITLDPEVNPGLVEIIVEEGCYIVFINEAGTYNISYNLNTEVLSIEAIDN